MKKLLGLLAVAPLSLAACGEKDPVVETVKAELEVRYTESTETLKITGVEFTSEDDALEFNAIGKAIRESVKEKAFYGNAKNILIEGTLDGEEFSKMTDVSEIEPNSGDVYVFITLDDVMLYTFDGVTDFTADGTIVKNIKNSAEYVLPQVPGTDYVDRFKETVWNLVVETPYSMYGLYLKTDENAFTLDAYNETQAYDEYEMTSEDFGKIIDLFDHSNFVFEKIVVGYEGINDLIVFFHYNLDPGKSYNAHMDVTFGTKEPENA